MRAEQHSQHIQNTTLTSPTVTVENSSSDDASLTPKETRLNPPLSAEDFGDRSSAPVESVTPVRDSADVSTVTPKGTTLIPMSFGSEDFGVKNSDSDVASKDSCCFTDDSVPAAKRLRLDSTLLKTQGQESSLKHQDRTLDFAVDSSGGGTVIMVCSVTVRKEDSVKLEMGWVDGQNRELMHQLLQFFKNRLV